MIKAPAPTGTFEKELVPAGLQVARCYSMIHIGTVEWDYMGQRKSTNKVRLTWEFPNEMRTFKEENGLQPMVLSKEFTLSMYEKANLRQALENWRGAKFKEQEADDFDITKLIGVPCMINVTHDAAKNGNVYANIGTINPLPKGMECPPQINPSFEFNYDDKFDTSWVLAQPEFIKDMILGTPEYKHRTMELYENEELKKTSNEGFPPAPSQDEIPAEEAQEDVSSDELPF